MNQTLMDPQELAGIAQARAAFTSFLKIHFITLPDASFVDEMRQKEILLMLQALAGDPSVDEDVAAGASLMRDFLEGTRREAAARLSEKLGVDRTRIYRGVSPAFSPPPPYEMVWSHTWRDIGLLQVLAGIYRQMGLEPSPQFRDRLDYIGIELEYLHSLAAREAQAWEAGETETALALFESQRQFFLEHLEPWPAHFIAKALEYVTTDFYEGHLLMLRGFLKDAKQEFASLAGQISKEGESSPA